MILQLSLFQIFFMALSIVGLSFSILYLFIGGNLSEEKTYAPDNVVDFSRARRSQPTKERRSQPRPTPTYKTSRGRQRQVAQPSMRVIEVNYRVVEEVGDPSEITAPNFKVAASE